MVQQRERVKKLEDELAAARLQLEAAERRMVTAERIAAEATADATALPDPTSEIEQVQERLQAASAVAAKIEPWNRWESAVNEMDELAGKEEELTTQLQALKRREAQMLEQAGIPIPGLTFSDSGEPLLNGRSLALASGRERIEVAVAVAMAANPDLKICLLDEANDLGLKDLERLDELAKQHGFQIWACRIGLEGPGEIVVDDGEAWGRDDPREEIAVAAGVAGELAL